MKIPYIVKVYASLIVAGGMLFSAILDPARKEQVREELKKRGREDLTEQ